MSDELKLYSPQDLADVSPYSVGYIRRHAVDFGFVRIGRRWVALRENIEAAVQGWSERDTAPSSAWLRSRTSLPGKWDVPSRLISADKSPLQMRLEEMKAELREKKKSRHGLRVDQRNIGE